MNRKFRISLFFLLLTNLSLCFAQSAQSLRNLRICLWAEMDVYPEFYEKKDDIFEYSKKRIVDLSEFLFEGMVYGWHFVYTPSDKLRGVEEYLEVTPIQKLTSADKITYSDVFFEDNRVNVWCNFERKDYQIENYKFWSTIQNPVIHGKGTGKITLGFEGIEEAARNAVKDAVRTRYRSEIKNKPKEISGSVLIRQAPLIGIDQGQYVIFLDFFLEHDKIIMYQAF